MRRSSNLAIHSLKDGSGRMARALQTMVLAMEDILAPAFSSIEEYVGRNPQDYYNVLAEVGQGAWHPENDPLPWIRFRLVAHYRQVQTLLRRYSETSRLWHALAETTKQHKLNERVINALAGAAIGLQVKNPTYRKQADITDQVARNDLTRLSELGLLTPRANVVGGAMSPALRCWRYIGNRCCRTRRLIRLWDWRRRRNSSRIVQ